MSNLTEDEIDDMLRGAVLRERERCARVFEKAAAIVAACIRNDFDPDKVDERERAAQKIALLQTEIAPDLQAEIMRRITRDWMPKLRNDQ